MSFKTNEFIIYSPELNVIEIVNKTAGFVFKDEGGEFFSCYYFQPSFRLIKFYIIGEL